jgi:hypothetical protein
MASSLGVRRVFGLLAMVVALSAASLAQEATRRALLGLVTGPDGKPLAGAQATLVALAPSATGVVEVDRLEATTDARGRFKVQALANARYLAYAFGPVAEDGTRLVGPVAAGLAGGVLQLACTTRVRRARCVVRGLEAWADRGPFAVRMLAANVALPGPTALDADGAAVLPWAPLAKAALDLVDGRGEALQSFGLDEDDLGRTQAGKDEPPPIQREVHRPQQVPFLVVDEQGAPCAGVEVRMRIRCWSPLSDTWLQKDPERVEWRSLGKTGEDGRLEAAVPAARDPFAERTHRALLFCAGSPGCMASWAGFFEKPFCDGKMLDLEGKRELFFVMRKQAPWTLTMDGLPGVAGAEQKVSVRAPIKIEMADKSGWWHESLTFERTVEASGRIVIEEMPATFAPKLVWLGASSRHAWLPDELLRDAPPSPIGLRPIMDSATLAPRSWPLLRLEPVDLTSGPGAKVEILAVDLTSDFWNLENLPHWTTDIGGALAVRLAPGPWGLLARSAGGYAWLRIEAQQDEQIQLRLQPLPTLRGRVVDPDGAPVEGAVAYLSTTRDMTPGAEGGDGLPASLAGTLCSHWCQSVLSAADGSFVVPFLTAAGLSCELDFYSKNRKSEAVPLEDLELTKPVVLR